MEPLKNPPIQPVRSAVLRGRRDGREVRMRAKNIKEGAE